MSEKKDELLEALNNFNESDEITTEHLDELNKALEAKSKIVSSLHLKTEDLSAIADKYLSAGAKAAFQNKALTTYVLTVDGKAYRCLYLARRVLSENTEKAVEKLASTINILAEQGLIHSVLAPMTSIPLVRLVGEKPSVAVFSFVLVPDEDYKLLKEVVADSVEEGSMAECDDDLSLELATGEFLAEIRISGVASILSDDAGAPYRYLQHEIDQYLAILPKGTKVVRVSEVATSDLSTPYEVIFSNPLLKNVRKVSLDYVRYCEEVDQKLEQFNLLLGVRYLDSDNQPLFKGYQQ